MPRVVVLQARGELSTLTLRCLREIQNGETCAPVWTRILKLSERSRTQRQRKMAKSNTNPLVQTAVGSRQRSGHLNKMLRFFKPVSVTRYKMEETEGDLDDVNPGEEITVRELLLLL